MSGFIHDVWIYVHIHTHNLYVMQKERFSRDRLKAENENWE